MRTTADNQLRLDLDARAKRLGRIVAQADVAADYPLLKVVRIAPPAFTRLEAAVAAYIWHSLSRAYPDRSFALGNSVLTEHASEIRALPNRTPNGVLLPRRETFQSFNLIHQALADVVEGSGLLGAFSFIQIPCNVRIVNGAPDPVADARSYASSKMHTDVWNGEPLSSVLFNIPVLGDPKAVDLRFYEPRTFPAEMRRLLGDYTLGKAVTESAVEYPAKFEMGHMYISDALSLHQTMRIRPTLRVSLDFRTIARELVANESPDHSESRAVYVRPDAWRAGGSTTILASGEPLNAFQRRQAGERIAREALSIVDIDDSLEQTDR